MTAVPRSASEHPPTWKFDLPIYHAESRAQWRAWLAAHHDTERGVWLCSWRTPTGRPTCPYADAVEEAICFGWIDATVNVLDDERALQLMTPRKAKGTWTRLNRRRVEAMEAAGLMTDAGRRAVEIARRNGSWTIYDPVEDLLEPVELAAALDAEPAARQHWDAFPPSAKKMMLWWVISAAKDETRQRRIASIVEKAATGQRAQG
ncbi:MAG: YdeI/OmpD-associated family protein [Ilumatobacteraceae bacterium]